MRASRCGPTGVTVSDRIPTPVPGAGEALVRPLRVALSWADADAVRSRSSEPFTPGREFVGVVERLHAPADEEWQRRLIGARVAASPVISCGSCDLCRAGVGAHCRARRELGRPGCDGALAEHVVIPARCLSLVPASVDDDHAVLAASVAAAIHAARIVRVEGRAFVTVLGDTVEGLLTAQVVARVNPGVRVLGSRPDRLALCEKWSGGIGHRLMSDAARRQDQDVVFECTGTPEGLADALRFVRPRGTVVLSRPVGAVDLAPAVEHEVTIAGSRSAPIPEALALLVRREIDAVNLIGRRFRLEDSASALAAAAEPGALRLIVEV